MAFTQNTNLTISMITREALRVLENSLTFAKQLSREYEDKFGIAGAKIGTILNIRKPPRDKGRTGQALVAENATETSVPLALTTQRGVDLYFTTADLELNIDDFSKRFLKPAIANVANNVDLDGVNALLPLVWNMIGTPGTNPSAALTYLLAGQRLNEEACPVDDRVIVMPPSFVPPIVDALKGLFQSSERISEQYEKGMMGIGLGFKWMMDQNMRPQVAGPLGGAPVVSGANQTGNTLLTSGWTAAAAVRMNVGDVFTLPGVFAVNPVSKITTGALRQFTVVAQASSDATGAATLTISPPIVPPAGATLSYQFASNVDAGINSPANFANSNVPYNSSITLGPGFQNVTASPASGVAVTPAFTANQTAGQAIAFYNEWATMACADLYLPGGVDMASRVADDQLGLSLRMVRAYDINQDRLPTRLDILYGFAQLYGEFACRIAGA